MSQDITNQAWRNNFLQTMMRGHEVEVRGSTIKELEGLSLTVDPMWPFITFEARNYNFDYCKKELQWKAIGDKYDTRIEKYAKMWAFVKNDDGTFNSNYGQYWFSDGGVLRAVDQLLADKASRRASIPMLRSEHVDIGVRDTVCTEAMTFLIRRDKLNCHVHMRSSDQVYGLGTDIPSFSFVQRIVLGIISKKYPEVTMGSLTIVAASSHIYERHYDLYNKLESHPAVLPMSNNQWMPLCSHEEATWLCSRRYMDLSYIPEKFELTHWLVSGGLLE